ncbi:MAG: hypothetical protein PHH98_04330 [Candidatus Gracilibacteria bacterium]|nr:hypothetical protein [Candidatus Gracilibacteria bacterium]
MLKKILTVSLLLASFSYTHADTKEVECSTDPVFAEYSCNQCFDGGSKEQGGFIGLLTDIWSNTSESDKILYKEQQEMPEMVNLNTSKVEWSQTPDSKDFWEYTPEFEAVFSTEQDGYVLGAGKSLTWLKSKLGYAYKLDKNETAKDENIGLLIYPILSHTLLANGELGMSNTPHNECVLYKSAAGVAPVVTPPKTLPQTGPAEYFLLLILAMILGFGIVRFKNN